MLTPPPRYALFIAACFVLQGISKNSEFAGVGSVEVGFEYRSLVCITGDLNLWVMAPPSRSALINGAWFVLQGISSEIAGVGSAVEVGRNATKEES